VADEDRRDVGLNIQPAFSWARRSPAWRRRSASRPP